jgi:AcrR family transcriptional regulator
MQRLAASMSISTKTMYKFFADKEELLEECLKVHYSGMDDNLLKLVREESNPVASIWKIFSSSMSLDFGINHVFYHDLNYYYPELQDKVIKLTTGKAGPIIGDVMKQGITEGYFLSDLNPSVVLKTVMVLYTSITRSDGYKEFDLTPEQIFGHTIIIYLRGLCTDKGLKIMNQLTNRDI